MQGGGSARGFAGPSLLAMMLVEKYANHQPLNRRKNEQNHKFAGTWNA
jgi:transposase